MTSQEARTELGHLNVAYNESSFIDAARNGDVVAVDLFLKAGIDPDARDTNGRLACDFPDTRPNDELVAVIELQKQLNDLAAISHREQSTTALMAASAMGRADIVQRLLNGGASSELTDRLDMTALMYATWRGQSAVVKVLLRGGANPAWYARKLKTNIVKAALNSRDPETISAIGTGERR
jgi:ankyrin repeat protein